MESSNPNPFAALLRNDNDKLLATRHNSLSSCLEKIFGFTIDGNKASEFIFLKDVSNSLKTKYLDLHNLKHALFDRLFMCTDEDIVKKHSSYLSTNPAYEWKVIVYLYNCYRNVQESSSLEPDEQKVLKNLVIQNVVTAYNQPEIYSGQDLYAQFLDLLMAALPITEKFFKHLCSFLCSEQDEGLEVLQEVIEHVMNLIIGTVKKSNLITLDYQIFNMLHIFISDEVVADILITKSMPSKPDVGVEFANTLLGALLHISITPRSSSNQYEYFLNPLDHASVGIMEGNLWMNIDKLTECIYGIILALLKCNSNVKNKTLNWLGLCLKTNADKGKIWNSQAPSELNPTSYSTLSDGFLINLTNVLLRLCLPFCVKEKVLKVDPTYCAVSDDDLQNKGIHLPNMNNESCLIPILESSDKRPQAVSYSFMSDCFYLTHRAFDLGYRIACERIVQLNQELGRVERAYNEAIQQVAANSDVVTLLKDRMEQEMIKYLNIKAQLLEPSLVKMLFQFFSSSTFWLSQVAVHCHFQDQNSYAPLEEMQISFPLPDSIPETLTCIPEFIVENIVHFLICQRRFNPSSFEECGYEKLNPILTFILIFMGSKKYLINPHIRAHLAEGLESLLPYHKEEPIGLNKLGCFQREMLFEKHELRHQIIPSLLEVFVGIEMTGQSVEFEQKFNYRRPMYAVMEYLRNKEEYENCWRALAEEAEKNMEAVSPPLFLKFVNLLLNDAVYLLDEALTSMAKLRDMQTARENGEWDNLSVDERSQNMSFLHHTGMIARFDNILGRETIKTIEHLTSKIIIVFTHPTMVDRVAAMLNYFLLNLVGPNKKNFKVKDQKEYSFDPAVIVIDICKIYINLKDSDNFCSAVSRDGRSYSPRLFNLAEDVLVRIGGGVIISELKEVAVKVALKAKEYQYNEEEISEAPEHFIDPIMSTIMLDPVILPSSKKTVDRTTIARHLLSDQTDPFNRAPLTMDQVIPDVKLANEIKHWREKNKKM